VTGRSISVVICAYADRRWNDLVAAVRSIEEQTLPADEIIVAVDHNDGLLQRVRQEMPRVVAVANLEHQGLSGTRNSGVDATRSAIVAFLDDDAIADENWLAFLSEGFQDPLVAGVGGSIEPLWESARPGWFPREFDWVVGCTYRGLPETPGRVRNLIGANMAYRRELFESVGRFRSGIGRIGVRPLGCEETEYCIRVQQRFPGMYFLYDPRALVHHRVPETRANWGYFLRRCYAEGISKTMVSNLVGGNDGLSSERQYTFHTLPAGVLAGLKSAATGQGAAGVGRSAAIVTGLTATVSGFAVSQARSRLDGQRQKSAPARAGTLDQWSQSHAGLRSESGELSEQELAKQHR
jgi:glycosyltransferase involved in cell wall biosynthesis